MAWWRHELWGKEKERNSINIAPFMLRRVSKWSYMDDHTVLRANYTMPAFPFVSVHQMAPPLTEAADIKLQLTTHLSTPKGWNAELAWLTDLYRTVYPHKWSPVSYRSFIGHGKFAGQRPTFYRCVTQPTKRCTDCCCSGWLFVVFFVLKWSVRPRVRAFYSDDYFLYRT